MCVSFIEFHHQISITQFCYSDEKFLHSETAVLRSKTIKDADPIVRETESDSDCLADRAVALDDQKVEENLFSP